MTRENITLPASFFERLEKLPVKYRNAVLWQIVRYAFTGIEGEMGDTEQAIWEAFKPTLDLSWTRYRAGKKGGAPKGNTNACKHSQDDQVDDLVEFENNQKTTKKQPKNNQKTTKSHPINNKNINRTCIDKGNIDNNIFDKYKYLSLKEKDKEKENYLTVDEETETEVNIEKPTVETPQSPPTPSETRREKLVRDNADFWDELQGYIPEYGERMIRDFYEYWTEPTKSGMQNRKGQEKTWCLSRRLNLWHRNERKYGNADYRRCDGAHERTADDRNSEVAAYIMSSLANSGDGNRGECDSLADVTRGG